MQTNAVETGPSPDYEAELRQRIARERDVEIERIARDKELEEISVKLDQEIEQEIRGALYPTTASFIISYSLRADLTEEERASIIAAPEFLEFVENSSKIVQRALNDGYDYIRDYTLNAEPGGWVACRYFHEATALTCEKGRLRRQTSETGVRVLG